MNLFEERSFEMNLFRAYFRMHWVIYSFLSGYFLLLLLHAFGIDAWLPGCLITKFTGYTCFGCGLNTAAIHLFQFDFINAFKANPLIYLYVPGIIVWVIRDFIKFKEKHNNNQNDKN